MIRRSRQAGRNKYPQLLIEQGVDVSQLIKGSRPARKRVLNPVNFSGVQDTEVSSFMPTR